MTKKQQAVIYLGGSYPQLSGIKAAKDLGLFVVVVDRDPIAPARKFANLFKEISLIDVPELLDLADIISERFQLICVYGIADYAFRSVAAITERFDLPMASREAFERAMNKSFSKRMWDFRGLPVSRGVTISTFEDTDDAVCHILDELEFPVIVKPADSCSSRGVKSFREKNFAKIWDAIFSAREYSDDVVVEELLDGRHFNVDGLFANGIFYPVTVTERFFLDNDIHQGLYGLQPPEIDESWNTRMFSITKEAACAIGLRQGPVTADIIWTGSGPVLLELSPHFHSIATMSLRTNGVCNPLKAWFSYLMGMEGWKDFLKDDGKFYGGYYFVYHREYGEVRRVRGLQEALKILYITDIDLSRTEGSMIGCPDGKSDLSGIVWAVGEKRQQVKESLRKASEKISFELK